MAIAAELAVLFAWSFLAATVLPVGSELAFVAIVSRHDLLLLPVTVASIGNTLGAVTTWWLGRAAARLAAAHREPSAGARRAAELVRRHGAPALLLSWVPLLGDALVGASGAAQLPLRAVLPWTAAGKLARYLALAWSVRQLG